MTIVSFERGYERFACADHRRVQSEPRSSIAQQISNLASSPAPCRERSSVCNCIYPQIWDAHHALQELFLPRADQKCIFCRNKPVEPAWCLLCGAVMCCQDRRCRHVGTAVPGTHQRACLSRPTELDVCSIRMCGRDEHTAHWRQEMLRNAS